MSRLALVAAAVLGSLASPALAANPYIHVDTSVFPHQFVDATGRAVIFHGVAAIFKASSVKSSSIATRWQGEGPPLALRP